MCTDTTHTSMQSMVVLAIISHEGIQTRFVNNLSLQKIKQKVGRGKLIARFMMMTLRLNARDTLGMEFEGGLEINMVSPF